MTAVAEVTRTERPAPIVSSRRRFDRRYLLPLAVAVLSAVTFLIVRPGVEDLWAARAREYAAQHGVGPTYWFSWFSGGSTPGNYSLITPYLSALLSAEVLGALSAVAIAVLAIPLLRGTRYPVTGSLVAAVAAGSNLWSGRIPFLLGSAFAVAALLAVRHQRRWVAVAAGVLSVFASPVSGAFLALALAAVFLARRAYRRVCLISALAVLVSLVLVAVVFGNPGPEHLSGLLGLGMIGGCLLALLARPADFVRNALLLAILTTVVLLIVPNGMGSNLARLVWFYVPVAVLALSRRRYWVSLLLIAPITLSGIYGAVKDVASSTQPAAAQGYYSELAHELDRVPGLTQYRLEVASQASHAADAALLEQAMLARGWESQEDDSLNGVLNSKTLNAVSYHVWLENNAVGYVAVPRSNAPANPESTLVNSGRLSYLTLSWQSANWSLYSVLDPSPIVGSPAVMLAHSQSQLTIDVPCACSVSVRVRYSKFLRASDPSGTVRAVVGNAGEGWTTVTTTRSGTYDLYGTISGLFG